MYAVSSASGLPSELWPEQREKQQKLLTSSVTSLKTISKPLKCIQAHFTVKYWKKMGVGDGAEP